MFDRATVRLGIGPHSSLFCGPLAAKNPIFAVLWAVLWTSAFSDVANWHQSQKVEHGCTTTKLPLSNGIKIVSVPNALLA